MSKRFRNIHPSDMTKLQRIVEFISQHSDVFARRVADSIEEPVAREAANILVGRSNNQDPEYQAFASELTKSVNSLNRKLMGMAVA
jgi:hypothetical protein